jgi:hypothetical protein
MASPRKYSEAHDVESETTDHIRFIDQGENFEAIRCPRCHAGLEVTSWQVREVLHAFWCPPVMPGDLLDVCNGFASRASKRR